MSEGKLLVTGSLILSTNFILFALINVTLVYAAAILFAVGNGQMWPSMVSTLSRYGGIMHQGPVYGVASSFSSLASIIELTAGGLFVKFAWNTNFLIGAGVILRVLILSLSMLGIRKGNDW